jgi:hypothetical protein
MVVELLYGWIVELFYGCMVLLLNCFGGGMLDCLIVRTVVLLNVVKGRAFLAELGKLLVSRRH